MQKIPCLLVLVLTSIPAFAEPEIKGTPSELAQYLDNVPRTVQLSGESELKVPADRALVSLKVVTENKSLQEASRLNQELRAKIQATLKERGFPADRVQPSKFSSTPKYGLFGEKAKSYRVENVVKITAQDEAEFQVVSKLVDTISEVQYDSIEFQHSDKEGMNAKALEKALDKVTAKKQVYEDKLGVKLSAKGFAEEGSFLGPVWTRPNRYYSAKADYNTLLSSSSVPAGGEAPPEMPTSFAELIFKATVTVEYSVAGK